MVFLFGIESTFAIGNSASYYFTEMVRYPLVLVCLLFVWICTPKGQIALCNFISAISESNYLLNYRSCEI